MAGRSRTLLSLAAIAALSVVGTVGCGGTSDPASGEDAATRKADDAAVRELATRLKLYTLKQDPKGICRLFEPARMRAWLGKDCVRIFKRSLKQVPTARQMQVKAVTTDGDRGAISFAYGEIGVTRIQGEWYLATPDTAAPDSES
ncbi:MAG: hypothetical protein M9938_06640 [Solirubrobacterales bacterium]|nr:hypothetical protein [Solirubrobacterales bacterium]